MTAHWLVSGILLSVLADTVWTALFRAGPVGRFKIIHESGSEIRFTSSTGNFVVNRDSRTLRFSCGRDRGVLRFDEIRKLEYHVDERYALLAQLFVGLNRSSLLDRYHDTVDWFSITVLTLDGRRIPLFLSGQYQPREFLLGWYIDLQAELLEYLGLMVDVEKQGRAALDAIQARMPGIGLL